MSREEAIAILHGDNLNRCSEKENEALEMAIKALEQEPYICDTCKNKENGWDTEPCDGCCGNHSGYEPCDVISREDAIAEINDTIAGYIPFFYGRTAKIPLELDRAIMRVPSVTQKFETVTEFADRCRECGKMRKGHWIYDKTIENWRCSKCNETPKTMGYVGTADFMAEHFKFCNHCGVKMV